MADPAQTTEDEESVQKDHQEDDGESVAEREVVDEGSKGEHSNDNSDDDDDDEVVTRKTINAKDLEDSSEDNDDDDDVVVRRISIEKDSDSSEEEDVPARRATKDDDDDDESSEEEADKVKPPKTGEEEEEEEEDSDDNENEQEDNDDIVKDDEEDEEEESRPSQTHTIYDFDIMMAKKKEENSRKRKRRNYDIINDNDDMIADIINKMRDAVEADIEANKNKMVATGKLKLLPFVINQLRKVDLRDAFLDSDVLSVMTEWLSPLPDRSLPHLNIRESLLKILLDFNLYDVDRIKSSGIGKAIMYLYKHPKETKENKQRAKQLISSWSRPIFNLDSSFSAISREEREERDLELQKRARHVDSSDGEATSSVAKRSKEEANAASKPGEKGWIPRARVPAPSMRDYVIRPRSKVDGDIGKASKRPANMLEKLMKNHLDRRRANRQQRAVNMKIDKL